MKTDELAFFNQQLAVMLRDRMPLEGALRELSGDMAEGKLRSEIEALEKDLGTGLSLREALDRRDLPAFYKQMVLAGAASNDLPGMLTLLADYYNRAHALSLRFKGLMVYPLIVIGVAFVLALIIGTLVQKMSALSMGFLFDGSQQSILFAMMWAPPVLLGLAALAACLLLSIPRLRSWARWRMPGFREASISQLCSAMRVMLKGGASLPDALSMAQKLEVDTPAAPALAAWQAQITKGQGRLADWTDPTNSLPPLMLWLVKSSYEDPASGFQKAADLYNTRSGYRTELLLYGALPVSVLILGQMVILQAAPVFITLLRFINMVSDVS